MILTAAQRERVPTGWRPGLEACVGFIGLTLMIAVFWPQWRTVTRQTADFSAFWVAGTRIGATDLYDEKPYIEFEAKHWPPQGSPSYRFYLRFPWHALIAKPFTLLPYPVAACAWNGFMIAAVLLFLWTLPEARRSLALLTFCWSVPLANALVEGQDSELVLAAFGVSMWALRRGRPWVAGAALAVCGLKMHYLVPIFLVIILRNEAKVLGGLLAGLSSLTALSFWLQPNWLLGMLISDFNAWFWKPDSMPNLYGIFSGYPYVELAASLVVLGLCGIAANRLDRELASSLMLAAGVILGRHSFSQDLMLTYPMALLLAQRADRASKVAAALILSPILMALYLVPISALAARVMTIAVLGCIAWCTFLALEERRRSRAVQAPLHAGQTA